MKGLDRIASAFNDAWHKFDSLDQIDRKELLALLCTPSVGFKLGGRAMSNYYVRTPQRNNQHATTGERAESDRRYQVSRFTGSRTGHRNPQANTTAHQAAVQFRNHPQVRQTAVAHSSHSPQNYTTAHQAAPYQNHVAQPQTARPYQNQYQQVYDAGFQTGPYLDHDQVHGTGVQTARRYQRHNHVYQAGFQPAGTYQNQSQQVPTPGIQTTGPNKNQQRRKAYASNHQANRHAVATARYEPVRGQFNNGSTWDSRPQASNSAASQR